ncbi:MAG: DUF3488 domain-containing protein [Steroidobacteraceae bacterium]|nr:DUF3488 domain-containing protein [Deltaproteobacteria bacterium]
MVSIRRLSAILTYVIGLCGLIPLFPWLETAPRLILALAFLSGLWQELRGSWQIKPWMQNSAIIPVFLYYAVQFSRSNPVQPVVSLLAIMLAVRLSGEKTVRHSQQIQALSLFCLASSSLFDLSPLFLVYLGLMLLLVAVALVLLTFQDQESELLVSRPELRQVLMAGCLMPLLSLPLLLFLFPILPRTQMPLWNFLAAPTVRSSGFSDKVEPGAQASIGESRTLAFRAELIRQPPQQLYWRGTVFNRLQGQRWIRTEAVPSEQPLFGGQLVEQTIYPEPAASRVLIALDRPVSIALSRLKRSPDGVFEYQGSAGKRLNYSARSESKGSVATSRAINRLFYLHLPGPLPPKMKQLADDIRRRGTNDRERLELLEAYFRNGGYRYSLRGLPTGERALEQFLFETKQGHCEFFASAFALLLRSAGVPCRLVGGYVGGEYNEMGGYYLVSEDMAHVWVEALIEGSGWIRIDPSSFATNAGEVWGAGKPRSLLLRLRLTLDYFNYQWNRSVIAYDFEQQFEFARRAGKRLQGIDPARSLRATLPYLVLILFFGALLFVVRRTSLFSKREERILRRFIGRIERDYGIDTRQGQMGLLEIAEKLGNERASEFVGIYAGALYRDRRLTDEEYRRLRRILRAGFL